MYSRRRPFVELVKRVGNLFGKIISLDNLRLADKKARKGKMHQYGVQKHLKNEDENIENLYHILQKGEFRTSEYSVFKIHEPKERVIYRLPYYPDRVLHHSIVNVLEPIFKKMFIQTTYSCIKGRGVKKATMDLRKVLRDTDGTKYCLKLDIRKYYPSVDHEVLKVLLKRKFKDKKLLSLLYGIIESAEGLPIGNYLSQYLGNFYLTYFDHWLKEKKKVRYYFRYCDDLVVLDGDKGRLHDLLREIREYLSVRLKLEVKDNWQVFPVKSRGIDFVGYVHYHTHIRLRRRIKKNYIKSKDKKVYNGWLKLCDSKNLKKKYHEKHN